MKKLILAGLIVISALGFAKNNNGGNYHHNKNMNGGCYSNMSQQYDNLTDDQKLEVQSLRDTHRREMRAQRLNIEEINIKIEKELLNDKPNTTTIDKLIDQKSEYKAEMEKSALDFRLMMKEKFGFEMMGHRGMHDKMRKNHNGMHNHMNGNMNNRTNNNN